MKTNNEGFTLLEMLMVVFIIATLLILTIPNITKHKDGVEDTTCEAYADMVQTQIAAYELVEGDTPSMSQLISGGYIPSDECSDGRTVTIDGEGNATVSG